VYTASIISVMNLNFKFSLKNKLDETGDGVEYVRWKSLVLCTGY
jgi:hypothetical protein